jgi:hypothetical protein
MAGIGLQETTRKQAIIVTDFRDHADRAAGARSTLPDYARVIGTFRVADDRLATKR